jgi:hypothetical protein
VAAERNRRDFALELFNRFRGGVQRAGGPPPLGLHVLMGAMAPQKVQNMIVNITAGRLAPVR